MRRLSLILQLIADHGPEGYGQRGVIPDVEVIIKNGFRVGAEPISSRSKGMKAYHESEVKSIVETVIEKTNKDHTR